MFLQSSALYNPGAILERITIANADTSKPPILSLELAILEGKLGHHRRALQILTQDLCDATSAEAYCAQGGDVVPLKTAHSIGETYKLQHWTISNLKSQGGKGAAQMRRQKTVDESVKKDLLKVLLEVYMSAGCVLCSMVGCGDVNDIGRGTGNRTLTRQLDCSMLKQ